MKIKKLTIENFRCFKQFNVDFASGVTVIIGKNGSGKSSLINAIKHGLSFIFTKDTSVVSSEKSISASSSGINIIGFDQFDAYYEYDKTDQFIGDFQYPISITCKAQHKDTELPIWTLKKNSQGGGLLSTLYKDAFREFIKNEDFPILAVFSDSYPHKQTNLSKFAKNLLKSGKPLPVNFGYYQWDAETACTEIWEGRFINTWKEINNLELSYRLRNQDIENKKKATEFLNSIGIIPETDSIPNISESWSHKFQELAEKAAIMKPIMEANRLKQEFRYVTDCLKTFTNPISNINENAKFEISDISIRSRYKEEYIEIRFADGRQILFNQLPTGYKRLLSIIFDIAYRSYIIKGRHTNYFSFPMKPEHANGIVVIDEIDLHLHPSLEQEVVQRLKNTFPNIQFILSTHSPLVITNLKTDDGENKILQLIENENSPIEIPDIYGIDYNFGLTDIMGTPARNSDIQYLSDSILRMLRKNRTDKVKELKKELLDLVGEERYKSIITTIEQKISL